MEKCDPNQVTQVLRWMLVLCDSVLPSLCLSDSQTQSQIIWAPMQFGGGMALCDSVLRFGMVLTLSSTVIHKLYIGRGVPFVCDFLQSSGCCSMIMIL